MSARQRAARLSSSPGARPRHRSLELRHSFVSLLSDAGVPLEEISQLVGHSGTTVTELVYRHQLKPVIQTGATVMDRLFGA
jgi:integrase